MTILWLWVNMFKGENNMRTMAISIFKTNALSVIDDIARKKETIVITRRGKPLAQVMPFMDKSEKPMPGRLASALVEEKDIVSPVGSDAWEANG